MKKIYMTLVAMLCGATAMAQTCTISAAEEIALNAGEQFDLELYINESEPGLVNGMGTVLEFPDKIAPIYDEDEEGFLFSSPAAKSAFTVMLIQGKDENENPTNKYTAAVASTGATFKTSTNVVAKIGIMAEKDITNGTYEIKVGPTSFNVGTTSVYPQDPFTIKVNVTGGTGINSVKALDSNAPIYNVAGQRVSKAEKGVYIQNGKKVAVK